MEWVKIALYIVFGGAIAYLTGWMAEKRGRDFSAWFCVTFILGALPVLVLFLLRNLNKRTCPECLDQVDRRAKRCKSCGVTFKQPERPPWPYMESNSVQRNFDNRLRQYANRKSQRR